MQNNFNGYVLYFRQQNGCLICLQAEETQLSTQVIAKNYMFMNVTTDYTNSPIFVTHDSCSQRFLAVKKKGDSAHVKNNVANIIGCLGCSKVLNKTDQEPAITSTEMNVVESLFESTSRSFVVALS